MTLSFETLVLILSFFNYGDLKKLNIPFNYYKGYIKNYHVNKSGNWLLGMYNNLNNKCFCCNNKYDDLGVTVLCKKCEISFNKNELFIDPVMCKQCINSKQMVRGKTLSFSCSLCKDNRIHMIVANRTYYDF